MDHRLIVDLKESYGVTVTQATPVTGGLLNQKWKVSTEKGDLLVKRYSAERFSREKLEQIEARLHRQIELNKRGVSCPVLWMCGDRVIRWLDDTTAYMVMDFCKGKTESSATITITQMHSLGSACAVMHRAFSDLQEPSVKSLPTFGGYTTDLLWKNFHTRMEACPPDAPAAYREALLMLEPIWKRLGAGFFDTFPKGYAHEDFQPGNILFGADGVSAIVDFDRNCYSYIGHDIGRAILSFALEDNREGKRMNVEKICAFAEGYSQHAALSRSDIADALRLSWCIETPWWIQPESFGECGEVPKRFKDEMLWLSEHWLELDSLLY